MRDDLRSAAASEVDRWERQLTDELNRLFDRQQAVVLARLQGAKARKHTRHWEGKEGNDPLGERKIDPRYIVDPARWLLDAVGSVTPILTRLMGSVYARVAKALDPSTPAEPAEGSPEAKQLEDAVAERVKLVQQGVETAVEEVQAFIASEDEAGSAMPAIADGVRQLYAARQPVWASRIATLSAVGSINQAALYAAGDRGASAKQWLSRRDAQVRDTHQAADGQVRLLDERFRLGGIPSHPKRSLLMFPGDPSPSVPIDEVINCRCTLLFSPPRKRPAPDTKALPKTETCSEKGCDNQATVRVIWADGRAYQAACPQHIAAVKARLNAKNGGDAEIVGVRDIKLLPGDHIDTDDLEAKAGKSRGPARVRTVGGARQYGQAIGTVIVRDPVQTSLTFSSGSGGGTSVTPPRRGSGAGAPAARKPLGKIAGLDAALAGRDPQVRALIAQHSAPSSPPDPASTEVLALRDSKNRVSGYVVWQTQDGPLPKGSIVAVSVHPAMKGQRLGDQMVAAVAQLDSSVKPQSRPRTVAGSSSGGPARPVAPARAPRAVDANGLPVIDDRSQPGDQPGTSGDFDADAARIDRLQKAYLRDRADTTSLFSRGGRYSRDREQQQQEIIDHFLSQPGVKSDRKILITAGMPGSGKTTSITSADGQQALGVDLSEYVTVNSDDVKEQMIARGMVPDYPGLAPEEAATLIQAEAFEVAHSLMRQAARRGNNYVYDTTLRTSSQLGQATGPASVTSPPGWSTTLLFVDVPEPVAKQRARDRYLAGGRYVPMGLFDKMRSSSSKYPSAPAEQFAGARRQVDSWVHMDNSGAGPVVVAQGGKPPAQRPAAGRPAAAAAPAPARAAAAPAPAYMPSTPAAQQTVAPSGNPNLPPPPAGSLVYSHPQGKTIYVLPDGSMVTYKPDGKKGTSSATPAKLAGGYGGWSLVAAAPTDGRTGPSSPAPAAAPKLVSQPKAPLVVQPSTPAPAGSLPVSPMDFNEAPLADVPKYIADPNFVFQQKVDGIRGVLVIDGGKPPWFASKKGDRLQSTTAAKITAPILAKMPATPAGSPAYRVEGELLNGKFHVFDMVVVGSEKLPYEKRMEMAEAWTEEVGAVLPSVEALPTARTAAQKQALWDAVVGSGAEGVMMKRRDAGYDGGARVDHTLKAKITATADVLVLDTGVGGKSNAQIGLSVGGKVQPIGTVSTLGKGPVKKGDVVEVEYLWATADSSLAQPRILRSRPDKTPTDVTDASQLRVVDKTVLAVARKWLAGYLERAELGALEGVR